MVYLRGKYLCVPSFGFRYLCLDTPANNDFVVKQTREGSIHWILESGRLTPFNLLEYLTRNRSKLPLGTVCEMIITLLIIVLPQLSIRFPETIFAALGGLFAQW
ncbi:hypothetical protein BDW75DRAFT_210277 [Aspergillus navahoensis]